MGSNTGDMIKMLRDSKNLTRKQFCDIVGISTSGLQYYEKGDRKPSGKVLHKIKQGFGLPTDYFSEELSEGISKNNYKLNIVNEQKERLTMNQQNRLIAYQEQEIQQLKERVKRHKSTPIQESVWGNLDFDYACEVRLSFKHFRMGRTILSITNKEMQSKVLGYSVSELEKLWDIGTHYENSSQHPIDTILHKSTIKNISEQIKSLPTLFESLKNMMGNHYIPQTITYMCKDKSFVNAIAYNKVNWKDKTVSSRIKFLDCIHE